jgi:phosphoribosylformylglycinamidine cyclo-ligase
MYRTFNMGMGYVMIAPKTSLQTITGLVPDAQLVGTITEKPGISLRGEQFS